MIPLSNVVRQYSLLTLLWLMTASASKAGIEVHDFDDSNKEALYKELIAELRCLVCQNQNLADSNAALALDLRQQTYDMVQSGASKDDVIEYMVQRYGDFVLYRPPFRSSTLILWVGPFVFLFFAIIGLRRYIRSRLQADDPAFSAQDIERAERLLTQNRQDKAP